MRTMVTSERGMALIREHEGYRAAAYRCPAGEWTIGYGHTSGVREGQRCTREDAERWLKQDVASAEREVSFRTEGVALRQSQFDALVSFVYNIGAGNFLQSTLLKKVLADPSDQSIRDEFGRWIYGGGRVLPGLVARRKAEADLYFSEINQSYNNK